MRVSAALPVICVLGAALWAAEQQRAANPASSTPAPKVQQKVQQSDEGTVISLNVNLVNLLFTVTDKKGRFVTDLGQDDFEVYENKKPQKISQFSAESDLPLRLAILIDTSSSIRERFRFEQEAAIEFLNSVQKPHTDKAMLVSFDTQAELRSDLMETVSPVANAIRALRPGGGTALYDAIFFASRDRLGVDQPRHKFRRAIVILSDGDDNQSRYSRDQSLELAQKNDVVIYAISTNITRNETPGDRVLKYFTLETGGRAFFPFKVEDLAQSFQDIANELRHQYSISYTPNPLVTDGLFHPIELKVKGRKDLVVRVRQGYYAPKM